MNTQENDNSPSRAVSSAELTALLHQLMTPCLETRQPHLALDPDLLPLAATLIHRVGARLYADTVAREDIVAAHVVAVLLHTRLVALGDEASEVDHTAWGILSELVRSLDPTLAQQPPAGALTDVSAPLPHLHSLLTSFALVLLQHRIRTGENAEMGAAVPLLQAAEQTAPADELPLIWYSLGCVWKHLADEAPECMTLAASDLDRAARAAEGHPQRTRMWHELALVRLEQYENDRDIRHLDDAIEARRAAVDTDSPESGWRFLIGSALISRFRLVGIPADLDEAISWTADELTDMGDDSPHLPGLLGSFGNMLLERHALAGARTDLEGALVAMRLGEQAAPPGHPLHTALHQNAHAVQRMWDRGQDGDAEPPEADGDVRSTASPTPNAWPGEQPVDPGTLPPLVTGLVARFLRSGDPDAMEAALRIADEAVHALPGDPAALTARAAARFWHSRRSSEPAELTGAVEDARAATAATAPDDPEATVRLAALSLMLRVRFENLGDLDDLDAACAAAEAAVRLADRRNPAHFTAYTNLSAALLARFVVLRRPEDIDGAVAAGRTAVGSAPDGSESARARTHLAAALQTRHDAFERRADLDDTITALEAAVADTPSGHVEFPVMRLKLSVALRERGGAQDLDASAALLRRTITEQESLRGRDPNTAHARSELGLTLVRRFGAGGRAEDLREAEEAFRLAAGTVTAPTRTRLSSAGHWGSAAMARGDAAEALDAYRTAVEELLPRLADRGLTRASRLAQLAQVPLLSRDAAAAAIAAGDLPGAVRLLEQSRSVIWSQLTQTRTDRTDLRAHRPELAAEFDAVCAALETGSPGGVARDGLPWELSERFDTVLARIRALPGFTGFLAPPDFDTLRLAAKDGPVVIVNISPHRCDALLLSTAPGEPAVRLVELPHVSAYEIERHATEFGAAVGRLSRPGPAPGPTEARALAGLVTGTLTRLWEDIARPVLTALGLDRAGPTPPRLWWCPTGPLALLPLHAAGPQDGPRVMDLVVSSYTPTLSSLIRARSRPPARRPRVLGVGVRHTASGDGTSGRDELPGTGTELAMLTQVFGERHTGRADAEAVLQTVLAALPAHPWVHFACHGVYEANDPSGSHLALYDGPLTVTGIAEQDLSGADLAFLSACHTALGADTLADEAIHPAAAFQLAGFRHVVGTLWRLADGPAPEVARAFYRALAADGGADRSARALHDAVQAIRRDPAHSSPLHWACYVHLGP
ncbi:CHAT domain-containing protein [Streptomyces sp. NPDC094049]|uniref:CHAT domain-containing protein n=1 Tax=Streptomyces sp. NPDC094049 TaxID=3154987 RepID=UPI00331A6E10